MDLAGTVWSMVDKRILIHDRVRKIPPSFSWVDHRLLRHGYLEPLPPEAMLIYFFLVLVGDCHGVSFYSDRSIAKILKLLPGQVRQERARLVREGLIAYEAPLYQVLSLPVPAAWSHEAPSSAGPSPLGQILKTILKEKPHGNNDLCSDPSSSFERWP